MEEEELQEDRQPTDGQDGGLGGGAGMIGDETSIYQEFNINFRGPIQLEKNPHKNSHENPHESQI